MVPPLEAEEILTYIKKPSKRIGLALYSKLYVHSNVVQKKRVAWILFFKIRPSQDILKIRDGTPLEAEGILTYIKNPRNGTVWHFYSKLYVPSNVVQKKGVTRILFFKIRPSQEILKIHDGTPLEILLFKIRLSQEILKNRDGTPLDAEEILTYIKKALETDWPSQEILKIHDEILKIHDGTPFGGGRNFDIHKKALEIGPRNTSVGHFSSKLDVPSNIVQKKRVAQILFFKIRLSQEILKNRDEPSQDILKICDGTPFGGGRNFDIHKKLSKRLVWHFYSKLYVHSNVVQKKRVAWILFFKIRPSQDILKIRDGTPLEAEEILTYIKGPRNRPSKYIVAQILFFKIRLSQEILKNRDGTPLEAEGILTYIKNPRNGTVWHFYSKLYVPSNVVQKKGVTRIMFFKIRPSQEILKIHDGAPLEMLSQEILKNHDEPSQEILKIHDGTPFGGGRNFDIHKKALEIGPRNTSVGHFSSKLDVPSNIVQKKRVARILFFKIMPSQEILKIRDGTPLEAEEILTYIKKPSKRIDILKICDGTPFGGGRNFDIHKKLSKRLVWHFYSKLYVHSNVVQKKRVAWILFFKIRPSQDILKIRDGTPLEAEEILTYIKGPRNRPSKYIGWALF
ncbi:hypothetical protein OROHE_015305 [Orobanche hederae]